jgi:hypothetical protein
VFDGMLLLYYSDKAAFRSVFREKGASAKAFGMEILEASVTENNVHAAVI